MARRAEMRKRSHFRPKIRNWQQARQKAVSALCAVCGARDAHIHVDHIVPAGLLSYLVQFDTKASDAAKAARLNSFGRARKYGRKAMPNAEDRRNLLGICASCHGRKISAEVALCAGRPRDYWRKLERLDWPMDRVRLALALYGLDAGLRQANF